MERAIDVKQMMSYPDNFDIIKVVTMTANAVLENGMIVHIEAIDAETSGLPDGTTVNTTIVITEPTILLGDDSVKLLGYVRNYSAIMLATQPTFANDITSVLVAGLGKNMSILNTLTDPITIMGFFNQIQLPEASTDTILIAYK